MGSRPLWDVIEHDLIKLNTRGEVHTFWVVDQEGMVLSPKLTRGLSRSPYTPQPRDFMPTINLRAIPEVMDKNIQSSTVYNYPPPSQIYHYHPP